MPRAGVDNGEPIRRHLIQIEHPIANGPQPTRLDGYHVAGRRLAHQPGHVVRVAVGPGVEGDAWAVAGQQVVVQEPFLDCPNNWPIEAQRMVGARPPRLEAGDFGLIADVE